MVAGGTAGAVLRMPVQREGELSAVCDTLRLRPRLVLLLLSLVVVRQVWGGQGDGSDGVAAAAVQPLGRVRHRQHGMAAGGTAALAVQRALLCGGGSGARRSAVCAVLACAAV